MYMYGFSSYLPARYRYTLTLNYLPVLCIYIDCIDKINSNALKIFKSLQKHLLLVFDSHSWLFYSQLFCASVYNQFLLSVSWTGKHLKYEIIYRSLKLAPTPVPYRDRLCILLTDAQRLKRNGEKLQKERIAQFMPTIVVILKNLCTIVLLIHTSIRHWKSVLLERI